MRVTESQAKILPKLDSASTLRNQTFEALHSTCKKTRLLQIAPVHPRDGGETVGSNALKAIHDFEGLIANTHGDVDDSFDATLIHHLQDLLRLLRIQVIVIINHWKSRLLHLVYRGGHHGARLKITQPKFRFSLGADHGDELVCGRSLLCHDSLSFCCRRRLSISRKSAKPRSVTTTVMTANDVPAITRLTVQNHCQYFIVSSVSSRQDLRDPSCS